MPPNAAKRSKFDSYPDRQDLNHELLLQAKKAGCLISIDTDAHHSHQLAFIELGLAAALKAKIDPARIINFKDAKALRKLFDAFNAIRDSENNQPCGRSPCQRPA